MDQLKRALVDFTPDVEHDAASGVVTTSHHRELDPIVATLRRNALLEDLSEAELAAVARTARLEDYPKQAYVFHRGDAGNSLYIVVSGIVEIIIQRGNEPSVSLSTCEAGGFFGEMALFDGLPRSATARVLSDCQVVAIAREALDGSLLSKLSARISCVLAQRLRKTDHMLADMAERVARAAYANVNSAVSVELDAIKTLHRNTEQVAADTLARSERRAAEVMSRADAIALDMQTQLDKARAVFQRWVAPIASVLAVLSIWYGVSSVEKVRDQLRELKEIHSQARVHKAELEKLAADSSSSVERLEATGRRARALEETVGELRAVRDAVGFDQTIDTPERLRRAALNHEQAKQEIRERYLATRESGPHYLSFDAAVVFEAIDTYVSLVIGGGDDGQLYLSEEERSDLLMALSYVLANLIDVADPTEPGHAARLFDRKVRDMLSFVIMGADSRLQQRLSQKLLEALRTSQLRRARESLALSLAALGSQHEVVSNILKQMQQGQQVQRAAPAALALAKLGDAEGYARLTSLLTDSSTAAAYPAAVLVAELGRSGLQELTEVVHASADSTGLQARVEHVLGSHTPKNCLEERYARHLLRCLSGPCSAKISEDESCPNYSAAQR